MKTLADLKDSLYEDKEHAQYMLIEELEDLTPFMQGYYKGQIRVFDAIIMDIRAVLKHHDCESSGKACLMCGEDLAAPQD